MDTVEISGIVDEEIRDKANAYIYAAGLTPEKMLENVWNHIARTGELPMPISSSDGEGLM